MRRTIVLLNTGHANDAETAAYQRRMFGELGYSLEDYSVSDPNVAQNLGGLLQSRAGEIAFFLSSNYYGKRIVNRDQQLLHTFTGIPLVIMQHDHPLYFLSELAPNLNGTITFAIGAESADFIARHYPIQTTCAVRSGSRPAIADHGPAYGAFLAKKNAILCPMNLAVSGHSLDGSWYFIKELPEPRRSFAMRLVELAIRDCVTPLHELAATLAPIDPRFHTESVRDMLLVLNVVKAWRRNEMVRRLIDLPILLSSEYIPADLELRYRNKITLLSRSQTMELYASYRFILNCNPVMTDVLHERVLEALYHNSVAISDPNRILSSYLEDERDYLAFDYAGGDMRAKVAAYLDDPEKAYALTESAYAKRRASRDFGLSDSYAGLLATVSAWWAAREAQPAPAFVAS